ncbi:hypothetical protein ACS0TY_012613 [Phlomoides rotata]
MTTYGTIPTSPSPAVNLDYIPSAQDRLNAGLATRRPWRQMFDLHRFDAPKSLSDAAARVRSNAGYFLTNYAIVVLVILLLSLLYHPISLIVFVATMAAWLFLYFLRDEPLAIFGRTISDRAVLIALAVVTVGLLMLTRATSNIVLSMVIGVVVVVVHGGMRKTDELFRDEEDTAGDEKVGQTL